MLLHLRGTGRDTYMPLTADFTRQLIYTQMMMPLKISMLAEKISATYMKVSTKYIMPSLRYKAPPDSAVMMLRQWSFFQGGWADPELERRGLEGREESIHWYGIKPPLILTSALIPTLTIGKLNRVKDRVGQQAIQSSKEILQLVANEQKVCIQVVTGIVSLTLACLPAICVLYRRTTERHHDCG